MGKESVISEKKAVARASVVHCGARYDYRGGLWQVGGGDFAHHPLVFGHLRVPTSLNRA